MMSKGTRIGSKLHKDMSMNILLTLNNMKSSRRQKIMELHPKAIEPYLQLLIVLTNNKNKQQ